MFWCLRILFTFIYLTNCRALALNCDAPLNDKDGAESRNWRAGKPVRVVRSSKGRRISKYAPEEGNRYDGIYKVCCVVVDTKHCDGVLSLVGNAVIQCSCGFKMLYFGGP